MSLCASCGIWVAPDDKPQHVCNAEKRIKALEERVERLEKRLDTVAQQADPRFIAGMFK